MRAVFFPLALPLLVHAVPAGRWKISPEQSAVTVNVFRAGPLASALHDHHFVTHRVTGEVTVDPTQALQGQVSIDAATLRETHSELNASDQAKVERQLQGPDVLNVTAFPSIRFEPRQLRDGGQPEDPVLSGELTLHGVTRDVKIPVHLETTDGGARLTGQVAFLQSEFGIKPLHKFLGAIQVQDRVTIDIDVSAVREGPP